MQQQMKKIQLKGYRANQLTSLYFIPGRLHDHFYNL